MKQLLFSLCVLALTVAAQPFDITVRNGGEERFEQVVTCELPAGDYSLPLAIEEVTSKQATDPKMLQPAYVDTTGVKPVVSWLMRGITESNAVRKFRIMTRPQEAENEPSAHLDVAVKDGIITIGTTYFSLEHPCKGHGGFPRNVLYKASGYTDTRMFFYDRLFKRNVGQYFACEDASSTAAVIYRSPLRAVVETRTSYVNNSQKCPERLSAVYRYVYTANSPVVAVSCTVTRGDDKPVDWDELHFMHLSRKDLYYNSFVTGEPVETHIMRPTGQKGPGCGGTRWAVFSSGFEAMGIGGGHVNCWDASGEFVYYIDKERGPFKSPQKRADFAATLYFGPANSDASWYSRWLNADRQPVVVVESSAVDTPPAVPQPVPDAKLLTGTYQLDSASQRLVFGSAEQGFPVLGLVDKAQKTQFFNVRDDHKGLWTLRFTKPDGKDAIELNSRNAQGGVCQQKDKALRFVWEHLALGAETDVLDVYCDVNWNESEQQFEFRIHLSNRSKTHGLEWSVYPSLQQVFEPGTGDAMLPNSNSGGHLVRNSRTGFSATYPCTHAPMQFMAFNLGDCGVYIASHDSASRTKVFTVTRQQDIFIKTYAEDMGVPGSEVVGDFPIVITTYKGNWWQAAKKYRRWAVGQPWTAKGPIALRKDYPKNLIDNGLWMCLNGDSSNYESYMMKLDKLVYGRTPVAAHWYCWHEIPFDHTYPEYFPTKPGMSETTQRLTGLGQIVMPYINGRLWDHDIPSYEAKGHLSAAKKQNGEPYIEIYGSKRRLVPNCPFTAQWQQTVQDICRRLMDECHVNAIYLDQIGAAKPQLCFDKSHNHPLGGGRHWCDGYRQMLTPIKAKAAAQGVALTTENTAEPYMDNIDGYLAWNPRFQDDVPALAAVYSGYTIYFTSPQSDQDTFEAFRMAQGRDFLWGTQLGWNGPWILEPKHHDKFEYLIRLCMLQKAAKDFMVTGELIGEIDNAGSEDRLHTVWHRTKPHEASLPAVQSTVWKALNGDILIAIVNYSDSLQTFMADGQTLQSFTNPMSTSELFINRQNEIGEMPLGKLVVKEGLQTSLAPAEIVLLTLRSNPLKQPYTGDNQELVKSRDEWHYRESGGPSITLAQRHLTVVKGENPVLPLAFKGTTKKPVNVCLPDGCTANATFDSPNGKQVHQFTLLNCWNNQGELILNQPYATATVDGLPGSMVIPIRFEIVPKLSVHFGTIPDVRSNENFILPVTVKNNSSFAQQASVLINMPDGWQAEPGSHITTDMIPSGHSQTTLLKIRVPAEAQEGTAGLSACIVEKSSHMAVTVRKARQVMKSTSAKDGKQTAVRVGADVRDSVKITEKYEGNDDCSATVSSNWDAQMLGFHVEVKDNVHHQENKSVKVWEGDCVQIALRRGSPNPLHGYDGQEIEFALAWSPELGPYVFLWQGDGIGDIVQNALITVKREGTTTIYDAQIPWSTLNLEPPFKGQRIPFTFTINDHDGNGFHGWLEWTPGICGGKDSSAFGWLQFE